MGGCISKKEEPVIEFESDRRDKFQKSRKGSAGSNYDLTTESSEKITGEELSWTDR